MEMISSRYAKTILSGCRKILEVGASVGWKSFHKGEGQRLGRKARVLEGGETRDGRREARGE